MTHNKLHKHLQSRGLTNYQQYGMTVTDNQSLYIPLWNLSGQLVGFQTYIPDGERKHSKNLPATDMKYYTSVSKLRTKQSNVAMFGLSHICKHDRVLFVVEGVFDAISIHNCNRNAVAILGVGSAVNRQIFNQLSVIGYKTVAVCDGDEAGSNLQKYTDDYIILPRNTDANDMHQTTLNTILNNY